MNVRPEFGIDHRNCCTKGGFRELLDILHVTDEYVKMEGLSGFPKTLLTFCRWAGCLRMPQAVGEGDSRSCEHWNRGAQLGHKLLPIIPILAGNQGVGEKQGGNTAGQGARQMKMRQASGSGVSLYGSPGSWQHGGYLEDLAMMSEFNSPMFDPSRCSIAQIDTERTSDVLLEDLGRDSWSCPHHSTHHSSQDPCLDVRDSGAKQADLVDGVTGTWKKHEQTLAWKEGVLGLKIGCQEIKKEPQGDKNSAP
ncbi:hypothetical protein BDK51DRAFT_34889 [Blyttiomyces helicus]|uniref:Uncharacterized protein n=1 Tax=Blyttiomyces helicus TaxID=388810 RepID=A0A4P9W844_9FUNG|nr:hypothetical protein BDK51DRAFT_34889 [Blyttiomyces helicus]|eukprot:RKO87238.1 hypothetical protein BDK51DRAFT_34889 [Blyttiomyces helicus]